MMRGCAHAGMDFTPSIPYPRCGLMGVAWDDDKQEYWEEMQRGREFNRTDS